MSEKWEEQRKRNRRIRGWGNVIFFTDGLRFLCAERHYFLTPLLPFSTLNFSLSLCFFSFFPLSCFFLRSRTFSRPCFIVGVGRNRNCLIPRFGFSQVSFEPSFHRISQTSLPPLPLQLMMLHGEIVDAKKKIGKGKRIS